MNWEKLTRDFRENRCILLLGPHLASVEMNGRRIPLHEKLAAELAALLAAEGVTLEEKERKNLTYVAQRYVRNNPNMLVDLWDKVDDFYRNEAASPPPVYEKIAALPVSILISAAPDGFVFAALQNQEKEPWPQQHYNFRRNQRFEVDTSLISPQKPLIYNLFGSLRDKESLVLTPADQMEFVRKILEKNPPAPTELLALFRPYHTYIFLGFDLENWYLRLIIDGLSLCGNTALSPQSGGGAVTSATRAFYEEKFNFHFIDDDVDVFATQLLERLNVSGAGRKKNLAIIAAPADAEFVTGLERAMLPGEKNGEIDLYHRGRAPFGQSVDDVTKEKIAAADAVLALVSPDFFADDDILDKDFEWAKSKPGALIPVVIRSCDWRANSDLRKITPLPDDALPVSLAADRDEALQRIVDQLKRRLP